MKEVVEHVSCFFPPSACGSVRLLGQGFSCQVVVSSLVPFTLPKVGEV